MRRFIRRFLTVALVILGSISCMPGSDAADPAQAAVHETAVRFHVLNVNRSLVPCPSDGRSYEVAGILVTPEPMPTSVSVYVHGSSGSARWWHVDVAGYDHAAEMARLGHASLLLDRLGYAASDHPSGFETCIGSEADVVYQLVGQLRAGSYEVETGEAVAFSRIVLVGHSSGAVVAEAAAYSFDELDGLVVIGSPVVVNVLPLIPIGPYTLEVCASGGESPAEAPGVRGYVRKWQRFEDEAQVAFPDADPEVYAALAPLVHHDPCGEEMTVIPALFVRDAFAWRVTAPVMAIFGERDAFAPPPNADLLAALYVGASDVTVLTVPGAGHSPQLAPSAPELREALHRWLHERAF